MQLRRGPTQGPSLNPGGAPPGPSGGLPGNPAAADPGSLVMAAIAKRMSEAKKSNADFAVSTLDQVMRVLSTMQIHSALTHPKAAEKINRAWANLGGAKKDFTESIKEQSVPTGPGLGFSGAQIGPSQANPMTGGGPRGPAQG